MGVLNSCFAIVSSSSRSFKVSSKKSSALLIFISWGIALVFSALTVDTVTKGINSKKKMQVLVKRIVSLEFLHGRFNELEKNSNQCFDNSKKNGLKENSFHSGSVNIPLSN